MLNDSADIETELTRLRQKLVETRSAEERERLIIEHAPNGLFLVNHDGLIVLANAQAERIFGYSRAELIGQSIDVLVPARLRVGHVAQGNGYLANPVKRPMGAGRELFGIRQDGLKVPIEIGLSAIETGDEAFVLAAVADFTLLKELYREIDEFKQTLDHTHDCVYLCEVDSLYFTSLNGRSRWLGWKASRTSHDNRGAPAFLMPRMSRGNEGKRISVALKYIWRRR